MTPPSLTAANSAVTQTPHREASWVQAEAEDFFGAIIVNADEEV
jgi:hypothetical protein